MTIISLAEFEKKHRLDTLGYSSKFGAVLFADLDEVGAEHEHLVKGILTRGEVSMLVGPSGSGKSFLATDMSMSVARGIPMMPVAFPSAKEAVAPKVRRGGVVYIAGEGARGLKKRLRAYREAHGLKGVDLPFVLLTTQVDLHGSDDHTVALIEETKYFDALYRAGHEVGVELIVIDTLSASTPGANENASDDVSRILGRCHRLSQETGAHVMLVHHMNASGQRERGHSSLRANVDGVIEVEKVPNLFDDANRPVRLAKVTKQKDGEDGVSWRFVLLGQTLGQDADGEEIRSCIVSAPAEGEQGPKVEGEFEFRGANAKLIFQALLEALKEHPQIPPSGTRCPADATVVKKEFWREAYARKAPEKEDEKKRADAVRKAMERAEADFQTLGLIGVDNPYVWLTGRSVRGFNMKKLTTKREAVPTEEQLTAVDAATDDFGV